MARFALTFDDGPGPRTEAILDSLAAAGARATFFVLGRNLDQAPWCGGDTARARGLVCRALREGHVIGNHTWSHGGPPEFLALAADIARADETIRACRREAGLKPEGPIPLRLPYGLRIVEQAVPISTGTIQGAVLDPRLAVVASLGRTHVHWTSDFGDWLLGAGAGRELADRAVAHIEQAAALGLDAVLDLHDGGTGSAHGYDRPATAEAVRLLLSEAHRRGWSTFTVPA